MNHRRRRLTLVVNAAVVLLLAQPFSMVAVAQKRKPRPKQIPQYSVHAGSTIRVRLNQDIGSEKGRVGDLFTSTTVDPLYSSGGLVLAPQGSTITGRITNIQRAEKNGKPATLDVQFVSLKLPNGVTRHINGSLTDLSGSGGKSDNEGTVTANKTSHRTVKFIGGGAAGGAVIGAIAGGGKGLAIGAGVGALAGGITGRLKKGSEVKVKSGTEFGVVLNQAVSLPKYTAQE